MAAADTESGPGSIPRPGGTGAADRRSTANSRKTRPAPRWWKIHLFRGMINDVRRRAPYYWSDWIDAWDYRVVPATVYMYFANILPALAFSLDMFTKTNMEYGVNEVLLASVLGAVVFSLIACQPLVIVGVTGPITHCLRHHHAPGDELSRLHVLDRALGRTPALDLGRHQLVQLAEIRDAVPLRHLRVLRGLHLPAEGDPGARAVRVARAFYLSLSVALLVFAIAYICGELGKAALFRHPVRIFLKDYGTPLTVIFFTGFVHLGRMRSVELERLPTTRPFFPTADRPWLVPLWDIEVREVFLALPFAILLTVLFWFDHNVSSLIAQGTEFPLRKPAGFHWDIFLLGLTTGVAGILGLPFPNGLIPQAPFHTESLCVTAVEVDADENSPDAKGHHTYKRTHVVEQRVSNLAQGLLTLGTATGPLLIVLHLIPQAVLAGLFFIMGYQALEANGITAKLLFLLRDKNLTPTNHPLNRIPRRGAVWLSHPHARFLSGRVIASQWDVDDLVARKAEILGGSDLTIDLLGKFGPGQFA
ncbi:hypothetical protein EKO27_g10038 [Xylaria grammica]|uniref:Bicarbonate transporter-like transmembrane domain-containing protein n=1 Tax=Xylaria grammica TaxID=363999 RepID=A0A439CSD8_9PEZI|nr:hypothetical protein EKO27_g10038 [Xylaria grammica]